MAPDEPSDLQPSLPYRGLGSILGSRPRTSIALVSALAGGLLALAGAGQRPTTIDMALSQPSLDDNGLGGTFRLHRSGAGIESNQTGGACLVADIASLLPADTPGIVRGNCSSQAECNPLGEGQPWNGYCVKESRHCWYKPIGDEKQVCQKSAYALPRPPTVWPLDENIRVPAEPGFDVHAFYREHTGNRSARWRLVGCLNGQTPGCADGSSEFLLRYGPPKLIR